MISDHAQLFKDKVNPFSGPKLQTDTEASHIRVPLLSEIVTALDYDILSDMSVIITEITVEKRSFVGSLLWCRI